MTEFTIEIAGTAVRVQGLFGSTPEYMRAYRTEGTGEFLVTVSPEDLVAEQRMLDEEADQEGLRRRVFTEPFLERTVIQRRVAEILLGRGVLLLHGSTVAVDGKAFLFTAKTGVGKSTHTRYWRELFGSRAVMVNDDRTFLRLRPDGRICAYGSPWSGKHGLDTNVCAELAGICILEQGTENQLTPMNAASALPFLMTQAYIPAEGQKEKVRALTESIASAAKIWKMRCTKSPDAAKVAYDAMNTQNLAQ